MNPVEWERIDRQCRYEATKATAAADPNSAIDYSWALVRKECAELKGATFIGQINLPKEEGEELIGNCQAQAAAAVAAQPRSVQRNEDEQDIKVDCIKRATRVETRLF